MSMQMNRHVLLIVAFLASCVYTIPVDVALGKPISADVTCGADGAEEYMTLDQEFSPPQERVTSTCSNVTQYPASLMVDGDSDTWWQSTARNRFQQRGFGTDRVTPEARIVIDLQQVGVMWFT